MPESNPVTSSLSTEELARRAELKIQAEMVSVGFYKAKTSSRWLQAPELAGVDRQALLSGLAASPSPDMALPAIVRLLEQRPDLIDRVNKGAKALELYRLLGASAALGDFLIRHPQQADLLLAEEQISLPEQDPPSLLPEKDRQHLPALAPLDTGYRKQLLLAVGADPEQASPRASFTGKEAYVKLRVAYRSQLTQLAIFDLMSEEPHQIIPAVSAQLADLAAAALEAALAVSRAELLATRAADQVDQVKLAIIGMGKCGARELNYISDVDVIYVLDRVAASQLPEGVPALDESTALTIGGELVQGLTKAIMAAAPEPALWEVDANLRPEGKDGALVRTVDSYLTYYKRWAENWEFQALLKARPVAGDPELGCRWMQAVHPYIWESSGREGFVESVQAMRARVTDNIPSKETDWQLKLGPGGLRDIEFTVQLLQLVHGRTDESVRTQSTTASLEALSRASYIGRADAAQFADDYQYLRLMEHRIQLLYMRRTHLMPQKEAEQRILARSITGVGRVSSLTVDQMLKGWNKLKRNVRSLHERLFFRPLLAAVAHLSKDDLALSEQAARDRLAALGYKDPRGAMHHIQALTRGVQRSAEIQRTLMPVLLGWFARGVDPDAGLLGFRRISEALGTTPWYLRMLRDSPAAAERLCQILSSSRFLTDLLEDAPESISWLDRDEELLPLSFEDLTRLIQNQLMRHPDTDSAIRNLRMIRRREILRIGMGEAANLLTIEQICRGLSLLDQSVIEGALQIAQRERYGKGVEPLTDLAVIAMGRQGGAEIGYGSDADLMYVHQPRPKADEAAAVAEATELVQRMVSLLKQPCQPPIRAEKVLESDADLRPEGKSGPMVRSLQSFREYYERWADTWEFQALLRARPIAGSYELGAAFTSLIAGFRYPAHCTPEQVRQIRRMKARVENERMPRGADRNRQLKLGRGGLSDVEWLVQLLQFCHGHRLEQLQVTGTLPALQAAQESGLICAQDAEILAKAWRLATKIRGCNVLRTGRASDVLTSTRSDMEAIARWSSYPPGHARDLEEDYLRLTRQARSVFERLFFDTDPLALKAG